MNLEQLEYIVEVAKTGSLTSAAQNKHVTLSAISQSISHLETELGVHLFTRSRLGAALTPEGKLIIQRAYDILHKVQDLRDEAEGYSNHVSGELRVASIPGPMSLWVDSLMGFKRAYPNIRMEITEKGSQEILDDIRHNKLDIGLIIKSEHIHQNLTGLTFEPLLQGRIVAGVSRQSPLALRNTVTAEQLRNETLAIYQDDYVTWFVQYFQEKYGSVNLLYTSNNTDAIRTSVINHQAVTLGMDFSFLHGPDLFASKIITLELESIDQQPVYLGWVRAEGKHFSGIYRNFIARLKEDIDSSHP
ncbi:LysR family transcriptional regulator [Paenibacillus terrigena]|uniref:LysR family transcriptional regulator n=1 Tax=Paenibacillus terrigena TaxID=369333 RepID=UPI00035C6D1F|nr:LysR family transcriptional regulator [Paenibacillus terrigena]